MILTINLPVFNIDRTMNFEIGDLDALICGKIISEEISNFNLLYLDFYDMIPFWEFVNPTNFYSLRKSEGSYKYVVNYNKFQNLNLKFLQNLIGKWENSLKEDKKPITESILYTLSDLKKNGEQYLKHACIKEIIE